VIAIVDYGIGNLSSVLNMIRHVGGEAVVTCDASTIVAASGLIIPGVGSFDACLKALRNSKLLPVIEQRVFEVKTPVLGICVGMQMMARSSDEGQERGLGWFQAHVRRFDPSGGLIIPHMGWRTISTRVGSKIFERLDSPPRFYFVHSYHVTCDDEADIEALAYYGAPFVAAIAKDNLYGVQFHPEKSHRHGMRLFQSFLRILSINDEERTFR
jgi:imidazole glycerol-phosphate synthase subunit HisH